MFFNVADAFCFDPNEERHMLEAIGAGKGGADAFNRIVRDLAERIAALDADIVSDKYWQEAAGSVAVALDDLEGTLMEGVHGRLRNRMSSKFSHAFNMQLSTDPRKQKRGFELMQ